MVFVLLPFGNIAEFISKTLNSFFGFTDWSDFENSLIASTRNQAGSRNPVNEEKTRMVLVSGLNSYSSALMLAMAFAKNSNDREKINQQIRLAQFMMNRLNDPGRWKEIADAIWGNDQ